MSTSKPRPVPIRILNATEAAKALSGTDSGGKDEETLRRWRKKGVGPPFVEIGRIAYYRSDLLAFDCPVQGKVDAFPPSWEEESTINELLLLRLLLLQVYENWKDGVGYRISLDGGSKHFHVKEEVKLYLQALNTTIGAVEAERLKSEPSEIMAHGKARADGREGISGNRVLKLLERLAENTSTKEADQVADEPPPKLTLRS